VTLTAPPGAPRIVATTRARPETPEALAPLVEAGVQVLHVPLVRQALVDDAAAVLQALAAGGWTDVVVTSANGVRALRRALERSRAQGGPGPAWLGEVTLWAIGPPTARALETELALPPAVAARIQVPARFTAAGLVAHAANVGVAGRRFLYPAAAQAREELPEGLRALGARVRVAVGYDTVPHPEATAGLARAQERGLSLVLLASPSAARALVDAWPQGPPLPAVAAIGPTTRRAAREAGLDVQVTAQESTMRGLARAVAALTHNEGA